MTQLATTVNFTIQYFMNLGIIMLVTSLYIMLGSFQIEDDGSLFAGGVICFIVAIVFLISSWAIRCIQKGWEDVKGYSTGGLVAGALGVEGSEIHARLSDGAQVRGMDAVGSSFSRAGEAMRGLSRSLQGLSTGTVTGRTSHRSASVSNVAKSGEDRDAETMMLNDWCREGTLRRAVMFNATQYRYVTGSTQKSMNDLLRDEEDIDDIKLLQMFASNLMRDMAFIITELDKDSSKVVELNGVRAELEEELKTAHGTIDSYKSLLAGTKQKRATIRRRGV